MRALGELRTGTGALPAAARRAVRTTLAACTGFYVFLYGLGQPVSATYALFGAVSLAGLSRIPGTGRQRAAVMVRLLPVACVLVTLGTFLAVRTWSAVLGMAVIGFCVAFSAAAGPRPAGAAAGLQLLYILPSFPPYAPDTLDERLGGVLAGLLLLILAEAWVLPDPRVATYAERAAGSTAEAARCAAALERPPYVLTDSASERARAAAEALRSSRVPEAERPAGPGLRERALAHTGLTARTLLSRLRNLPPPPAGREPRQAGLDLLGAVRASATASSTLLRNGRRPVADSTELLRLRARNSRTPAELPESRRRQAALLEVADAAVALRTAAEIAVEGRGAHPEGDAADRFWYVRQNTVQLWWHRIAAHTGPRSVHFQNAVRIALALAVARTVAGLDSLPHGFWAMLAVISLTRTTAVQTRGTVRTALIGTSLGALAAGTVLALAGEDTTIYAIVLAPLMLFTFTIGPVRGVGWAQALFTLVVAVVFAQLSAVTWQLAEVRFLDVTIGSAIGIVCGILAWPRGAHDELGRAVAGLLRACADDVESTTAVATAPRGLAQAPDNSEHRVRITLVMAESAYAQYQSETQRPAGPGPDWQATVMTGHHVLWGAGRVLGSADGTPLARSEAAQLGDYAARVAAGLRRAAVVADVPHKTRDRTRSGGTGTPGGPGAAGSGVPAMPGSAEAAPPDAGPVYFATTAWLDSLTADLRTIESGRAAAAPAGPV
ncbi:FUSC family protein [Streptomyces sp. NBC_01443]|uniref:FUSC family protein n=1 Tax=Streptomyces sp. NBC_01443 TaxID=2903868 RepID=UPI002252BE53|nr:FUSC family protein [Streptomyces sp. NBC_01443]MCX4631370.1 FUSC family protein [Streptomyces sp. NBC_01443]